MKSRSIAVLAAGLTVSSCALLATLPGDRALAPPTVTFQGATLAGAPSQRQLAGYYCPDLVSAPFGASAILCEGFFGRRPRPEDMTVAFDLRFNVNNPKNVPLPMASVLAAVTVFPAATNQRLGAACVQLCPAGQSGCTGQAAAGACQASSRDVRSLDDFAGAATNLLIAAGVSAVAGSPPSFVAPQVAAASQIETVVRFSFGPEPLLQTMRQLASQSVNELRTGRTVSFNIPYRIEGTVWFDAGSFGRIAVSYGPLEGTWVLPAEGLLPR